MNTEKKIRRFFKENRPQVKGSDKFMADFVSKLEQVPAPAALSNEARILAVKEAVRSIKRRNRLIAVLVAALSIIVLSCITAALSMLPELQLPSLHDTFARFIAPISKYMLFLSLIFSAAVITIALKSLRSSSV